MPLDEGKQALVLIVAAGILVQPLDTIDLWFQSQVQSRKTVTARSVSYLVFSGVRVWLILAKADVIAFAAAATAETCISALGLLVSYKLSYGSVLSLRPVWTMAMTLLKESWPMMLSGLAVILYMRIDQVMLESMVGSREVGLYSAALRLSEVWYVIPAVLVSSTMPYLTDAYSKSFRLYKRRLQQLMNNLVTMAYIVAIVMTFISGPIIKLLYGAAYDSVDEILSVHIWAGVFVFLGISGSAATMNEGLIKVSLFQAMIGALVNISLNLYLIPRFGALGCAYATLTTQVVSVWLLCALFFRSRGLFKMQTKALLLGVR